MKMAGNFNNTPRLGSNADCLIISNFFFDHISTEVNQDSCPTELACHEELFH